MKSKKLIKVQGVPIAITSYNEKDYICLTDMTKAFEGGSSLIENWLRNKNTVEFFGIWERLNNPDFNSVEFDGIMMQVGLNRFKLSAKKWSEKTNAIGIIAKTGKYGGTYAHTDIAYHFGMWLSPEFNLLVIKEFQRLKEEEQQQIKSAEWLYHRFVAKAQNLSKEQRFELIQREAQRQFKALAHSKTIQNEESYELVEKQTKLHE